MIRAGRFKCRPAFLLHLVKFSLPAGKRLYPHMGCGILFLNYDLQKRWVNDQGRIDMDGIMFIPKGFLEAWVFAWSQFSIEIPAELVMKTAGLNSENTRRIFEHIGLILISMP